MSYTQPQTAFGEDGYIPREDHQNIPMNELQSQWIKYNNNYSTANMAPILPPLIHYNTISGQYFNPQNASLLPFNLSLPLLGQALNREDNYRDRIRVDPLETENETWVKD